MIWPNKNQAINQSHDSETDALSTSQIDIKQTDLDMLSELDALSVTWIEGMHIRQDRK